MKKMISIFAAILMVISCIVATSYAATEGKCGDNVTWYLEDGVLTISGSGAMYDYLWGANIPTEQHSPLYSFRDEIVRAVIEPGVETIGKSFFESCTNLAEVSIPETVKSIEEAAFLGCSALGSVELPDSVIEIGDRAFISCKNLTKINLPDGLEHIGEYAFQYCRKLDSIKFPSSLEEIGVGAYCDGKLYHIEFSEGLKKIGAWAFKGCGDFDEIVLPRSLEEIGEYAFSGFLADKMLVQNTLIKLSKYAFTNSSIFEFYYNGTREEFNEFVASVRAEGNDVGNEEFIYSDVIIVGTRHNLPWGDQFMVKEEPTLESHGVIQFLSPFGRVTSEAETPNLGDINNDDNLDLKDVLMLRRVVAGMIEMTPEQSVAADVSKDYSLNLKDILALRKIVAGIN